MEHNQNNLVSLLLKSAAELSLSIPDTAAPLFVNYLTELKKWNQAVNLTAIENEEEIVIKHFIDSIAGLKVIEIGHETELLDIGAGAGFPAIPLKLIRPNLSIELLEPSKKKSSFLRFVIGSLNIRQATVATMKLEDYVRRSGGRRLFDYIVVRAFKVDSMGALLGSLLKEGGRVVLFRTTKVERNFRLDNLALIQEVEYELPSGYGHRTLSVFSKRMASSFVPRGTSSPIATLVTGD